MELLVTNINEAVRAGDIQYIDNHLSKISNAMRFVIDNDFFHVAAGYGKLDLIKYFIETINISPNLVCQENQRTALHEACLYGDHQTVEYLINSVDDINAKDQDWLTPAHICAMQGHLGCLKLLQKAGADLFLADKSGMQLSHWAADKAKKHILIYLKDLKFPMETKCNVGRTPFIYAIQNEAMEAADYLVSIGCDINTTDNNHRNAVHYAAWRNKPSALKYLKNLEFNLSVGEGTMQTPAHLATKYSAIDCLHYLLEEGINPNIRDSKSKWMVNDDDFGNTLAHLAVNLSDAKFLCCIIKHGGLLTEPNLRGETAEYLAKMADHPAIIKKIKSFEKPRTPSPPKILPGFSRRLSAIAIQGTQKGNKKKDKIYETNQPTAPIPKRETLCPHCKQRERELGIAEEGEVIASLAVYTSVDDSQPESPQPSQLHNSPAVKCQTSTDSDSWKSSSRSTSPGSEEKVTVDNCMVENEEEESPQQQQQKRSSSISGAFPSTSTRNSSSKTAGPSTKSGATADSKSKTLRKSFSSSRNPSSNKLLSAQPTKKTTRKTSS